MKRVSLALRLAGAIVLCLSFVVFPSGAVLAQTEHSKASVTADTVRAKIAEVEATTDLDDSACHLVSW